MLPGLIILGAPKAGTTSLHRWLDDHPDVAGPSVKETEYFVDEDSHAYHPDANFRQQGIAGYERFFDRDAVSSAKVVFESAPDYMYQQMALDQLPGLASEPVFVFILREPAAQIYSLFHYLKNNYQYVPAPMSFSQFTELSRERSPSLAHHELLQNAVDNARYLQHIEKWMARSGEERVRVYLFDDLIADSQSFMRRVAIDLNVDPGFYDNYDFGRENETYQIRSRMLQRLNVMLREKLEGGRLYGLARSVYRRLNTRPGSVGMSHEDGATMQALREEFAEDNRRLANFFDLDLSSWSGHVPTTR